MPDNGRRKPRIAEVVRPPVEGDAEKRGVQRKARRGGALERVQDKAEIARELAAGALDVCRPGIAAAGLQDVNPAGAPYNHREGNGSQKVAHSRDDRHAEPVHCYC